jgi:hypothetical protein
MSFIYHGKAYDIQNLPRNNLGNLTQYSNRVLNSYQKSLKTKPKCSGFLTTECNSNAQSGKKGLCGTCYNKSYHLRHTNEFISQVLDISDVHMSSLNPLIYSNSECITLDCSRRTGISFPYCSICLREIHHLQVGLSNIPQCGLGLFATADLPKGYSFNLQYGSNTITPEEVSILEQNDDPKSKFRYSYLMQVNKKVIIDGCDETGGVLRFINNAPTGKLVNSRFYTFKNQVKVKTTKLIPKDCELFLIYNQSKKYPFKKKMSASVLQQRIEILDAMK